ncbi:MAG: hypothetical protein J6V58_01460 [Clostridia bacterium]|nr:hypothetical protein [Clostridia bacterium]
MVTGNLKNYTDENIIELIGSLKDGSIAYNLNDLKAILSEVNTRHLEDSYAQLLGDLIRKKIIEGDSVPAKEEEEVPEVKEEKEEKPKKKADKIEKIQKTKAVSENTEEEEYPVLRFMIGFLKVFGWIVFCGAIAYGVFAGVTEHLTNVRLALGSVFTGLLLGTVALLLCYCKSESIAVKLEIVKGIKKLSKDR